MKVTLTHSSPLYLLMLVTRECHDSHDKSDNMGERDMALLKRVIMQQQHTSLLEHINYTFHVDNICGGVLLELTRHRHGSYEWRDMGLAVRSSRFTLKRAGITTTKSRSAMTNIVIAIKRIMIEVLIWMRVPNDDIKLALPQAYNYSLYMTINARSLQNFLQLRLAKNAHYAIRELAEQVFSAIPDEHKFLFKSE